MLPQPKEFGKWIESYSKVVADRAASLLTGKYGAWMVSAFKTYEEFIKSLDGTAHANAYIESRSSVDGAKVLTLGPMQKLRADQLMGVERDLRLYRQTRLSFYRSHILRLNFNKFRIDLVAKGLTRNEKVGTIGAENP